MDRDKDIHLPSTLFAFKKDAVNALPVAMLMVVLFPILVAKSITISLYFFIIIFIFVGSTTITVTRELLITAMVMFIGIFIMAYSYDKEPIITVPSFLLPPPDSSLFNSILLTSVICFVVFIQGYFYSFTVKRPLGLLGYAFLYEWALVGIYFIVFYGFSTDNALMLGQITVILIPYM